jgi:hypothetical protein
VPQTWQIKAPLSATLWISANSQNPISRSRWQTAGLLFKPRTRSREPTWASHKSTNVLSLDDGELFTAANEH